MTVSRLPARPSPPPPSRAARVAVLAGLLGLALAGCGGGGSGGSGDAATLAPASGNPSGDPSGNPSSNPAPANSATPQITAVAPATVAPGGRVTLTGTALDQVRQVQLGAQALVIVSRTATTLIVDLPAAATTGYFTLVGGDGVARVSAQQVTVTLPITVTSFTPTTALRGRPLSLTGTQLDRATTVRFTGSATATPVDAHTGGTALSVTVPADAVSGVVTVNGSGGDQATTAALPIVAAIVVDPNATWRIAPGAPLVLAGSGFTEVGAVTIGAIAAPIAARTDTQLTVTVPAGVACGNVTLLSGSQAAAPAGALVVGTGCSVRNAGVEFAQVLAQVASDGYARLVPARSALVRTYVVSDVAGSAAPLVRLTATAGAVVLGSIDMTGPTVLPVLAAGAAPPAALRYDETQTFVATLPASWVGAGLQVRIDIDPLQRSGPTLSTAATPTVGTPSRLDLVLVPLVSGGNVPQMPTAAAALDEMVRHMPFDRSRITVTIRAPYTISSAADGVDTSTEWSNTLDELEQLRRTEAPNRHYFGMVKPMVAAGIAGIGYVNPLGAGSPALAALGWDASRASWKQTIIHEMGHNFSRQHAPCGGVSGPDPAYPYPLGALSATPLFDALVVDIISPVGQSDVMGYCNGTWFSDYNFRAVQRFVEAQPQAAASVLAAALRAEGSAGVVQPIDLLTIGGVVSGAGAQVRTVRASQGSLPAAQPRAAGDQGWLLRLATLSGATIEVPFVPVAVDHVDGEAHFLVTVPHPGALARIEVVQAGRVLPDAVRAARVRPQGAGAAAEVAPAIDWHEADGTLTVGWNAAAGHALAVTWVDAAGTRRTVLTLRRTGGSASFDTRALPAGGHFEFSLGDGLNARTTVAPR